MSSSKQLISTLLKMANSKLAKRNNPYFGIKPGGYGENDKLLGIPVPNIRKAIERFQDMDKKNLKICFNSEYHELRAAAVYILANRYKKSKDMTSRKQIFDFYMSMLREGCVNNWDLVDSSAHVICGPYLYDSKNDHGRSTLIELAKSKDLWCRRVSVLATFHHIKQNDHSITLELSEMLLTDEEDLIHKVTGWMLREVGKRDEHVLLTFLDKFHDRMPRVMLRYSLEKLSKAQKLKFMG